MVITIVYDINHQKKLEPSLFLPITVIGAPSAYNCALSASEGSDIAFTLSLNTMSCFVISKAMSLPNCVGLYSG